MATSDDARLYSVHGYLMRPAGGSLPLHELVVAQSDAAAIVQAQRAWRALFGDEPTIRANAAAAVERVDGFRVSVEVAG